MSNLINYNYAFLFSYGLIISILICLWISQSILIYLIGFLIFIINFGILIWSLGLEFTSLWLQIIYGGAITMFILITAIVCKIEFFNYYEFKFSNIFIDLILLFFFLIFLYKCLNFTIFSTFFLNSNNFLIKTSMPFIIHTLFHIYNKLILWIGIILMLIMIGIIEILNYNRFK